MLKKVHRFKQVKTKTAKKTVLNSLKQSILICVIRSSDEAYSKVLHRRRNKSKFEELPTFRQWPIMRERSRDTDRDDDDERESVRTCQSAVELVRD